MQTSKKSFLNNYFYCFLALILCAHSLQAQAPANDDKANATLITLDANGEYCSAGNEFNNSNATVDGNKPVNWVNGPYKNVWFKFVAPASGIANIIVKPGSGKRLMSALYDAQDSELVSMNYQGVYGNSIITIENLIVGDMYYLAVDIANTYGYYGGSFSLCIKDEWDFNNRNHPQVLTLDGNGEYCSNGAEFTNYDANVDSSDPTAPASWGRDYSKSVWFKFTAPANGIASILVDGAGGKHMISALYDASLQQVGSSGPPTTYGNSAILAQSLTPNTDYYIVVDSKVAYGTYGGTFSLCISNTPSFDYQAFALEVVLDSNGEYLSAGTEFNNLSASAELYEDVPDNWSSGPYKNVWFKFKPGASGMANIVVSSGSARRLMSALYDDQGAELTSTGFVSTYNNSTLLKTGLDPNRYYYLAVDEAIVYSNYGGSFGLTISSTQGYDYKEYAQVLTLDTNGDYCSNGFEFSNKEASFQGVQLRPANWQNGPHKNVWFKFSAGANGKAKIQINRGSALFLMSALYDANDLLIESSGYSHNYSNSGMFVTGLTPNADYFLVVDTRLIYGAYGGTFSVCISGSDPDFDYKDFAEELILDGSNAYCSNGAEFNNSDATPDESTVTNWQAGPHKNVWFKFKPSIGGRANITVQRGTATYLMTALYDDQGNELGSEGYVGVTNDNNLLVNGLESNRYYYLVVDTKLGYGHNGGTFSLCINVSETCLTELWSIASGAWNDPNTWSDTEGGQPVSIIPCENTVVYIKGFDVSFNSTNIVTAQRVQIIGTSTNVVTRLHILTGELNVKEEVVTSGPGVKLHVVGGRIKVTGSD